MNKKCFKCGRIKPRTQFYAHPQMGDGLLGKCKSCAKKDVRDRRMTPGGREALKAYEAMRYKTVKRKDQVKESARRRRINRPGRCMATYATSNAIRHGKLIKQPCEVCGDANVEAHHDDYRKKLSVRWLCFKHHRQIHGQLVGVD